MRDVTQPRAASEEDGSGGTGKQTRRRCFVAAQTIVIKMFFDPTYTNIQLA